MMVKKPVTATSFNMPSSLHMIALMVVLGMSIFVVYRYVKSLERELDSLKSQLDTKQAQPPPQCTTQQPTPSSSTMAMPNASAVVSETQPPQCSTDLDGHSVTSEDIINLVKEIENEDDIEVPCEETCTMAPETVVEEPRITNQSHTTAPSSSTEQPKTTITPTTTQPATSTELESTTLESTTPAPKSTEYGTPTETPSEPVETKEPDTTTTMVPEPKNKDDDAIVIEPKAHHLGKKTNEELKTLLKENGNQNLKGTKADLIKRLEEMGL